MFTSRQLGPMAEKIRWLRLIAAFRIITFISEDHKNMYNRITRKNKYKMTQVRKDIISELTRLPMVSIGRLSIQKALNSFKSSYSESNITQHMTN
jgi:prephenate dehydrogenase